ncbi:hypothetical protein EYV94_08095 [Puteibacter caeruleilacunae]|nr:hypothetical protein EYV94_08095 [Puteibacter caeruleilacunae]
MANTIAFMTMPKIVVKKQKTEIKSIEFCGHNDPSDITVICNDEECQLIKSLDRKDCKYLIFLRKINHLLIDFLDTCQLGEPTSLPSKIQVKDQSGNNLHFGKMKEESRIKIYKYYKLLHIALSYLFKDINNLIREIENEEGVVTYTCPHPNKLDMIYLASFLFDFRCIEARRNGVKLKGRHFFDALCETFNVVPFDYTNKRNNALKNEHPKDFFILLLDYPRLRNLLVDDERKLSKKELKVAKKNTDDYIELRLNPLNESIKNSLRDKEGKALYHIIIQTNGIHKIKKH